MKISNIRPVDGAKWTTLRRRRDAVMVGIHRSSTAATMLLAFAYSAGFGKKWG